MENSTQADPVSTQADPISMPAEFINLPTPIFKMGYEPSGKSIKINQLFSISYLDDVEKIMGVEEFKRVKNSFLGPILKFYSSGKMTLSGKSLHCILARKLVTKKRNELLFHFGGQPMRFSIREFHMVTGLKCSQWIQENEDNEENEEHWDWDELEQESHTSEDIIDMMIRAPRNAYDEKFCLGMLLLTENIFLHRYSAAKYPREYLEKATNLVSMMKHP